MYAGMLRGDFYKNLDAIINKHLGPALKKLEELNYSDESPYLSRDDYALLNEIKKLETIGCIKGTSIFIWKSR